MTIWGREPAVIVGLIVTIILGVVQTLAGQGFISDVVAGKTTDIVNAISQLVLLLIPLITSIIVRQNVYSPATYAKK